MPQVEKAQCHTPALARAGKGSQCKETTTAIDYKNRLRPIQAVPPSSAFGECTPQPRGARERRGSYAGEPPSSGSLQSNASPCKTINSYVRL